MHWILLCMVWGSCLYADDTIHNIRFRSGLFYEGPMREVQTMNDTLHLVHLSSAGRAQSQTMQIPINQIDWVIYARHAEQWQGPSRLSAPIIKHRSYTNIESFVLGLASLAVAAHYTYSNNYNKDIQRGAGILGTLFCFAGLRTETTYGLPDGTSIGLHRNW